ncbi:hypothetical protein J6590_019877 [Homalodisca vitripennis]|nr:hypothetical protein J6590_019877 [Homalodisca vitripennis]
MKIADTCMFAERSPYNMKHKKDDEGDRPNKLYQDLSLTLVRHVPFWVNWQQYSPSYKGYWNMFNLRYHDEEESYSWIYIRSRQQYNVIISVISG